MAIIKRKRIDIQEIKFANWIAATAGTFDQPIPETKVEDKHEFKAKKETTSTIATGLPPQCHDE